MKLYYFYDSLCGWCYGFSRVIQQLYEKYGEETDFEPISGGMVLGERAGPIGEVAPYIKQAYKTVEERTGVKFGDKFLALLDEGTAEFNSFYPAVALSYVKEKAPEKAFGFASVLQDAIYYDGIEPNQPGNYLPYLKEQGVDSSSFVEEASQNHFQELARADFSMSAQFGVQGFPTVVIKRGEEYFMIARGYTDFQDLDQRYINVKDGNHPSTKA